MSPLSVNKVKNVDVSFYFGVAPLENFHFSNRLFLPTQEPKNKGDWRLLFKPYSVYQILFKPIQQCLPLELIEDTFFVNFLVRFEETRRGAFQSISFAQELWGCADKQVAHQEKTRIHM